MAPDFFTNTARSQTRRTCRTGLTSNVEQPDREVLFGELRAVYAIEAIHSLRHIFEANAESAHLAGVVGRDGESHCVKSRIALALAVFQLDPVLRDTEIDVT